MKALALAGLVLVVGCDQCSRPQTPRKPVCFEITTAQNSASTSAEFAARHCQGGGVTWAELLRVLVSRRGHIAPVDQPSPDMVGAVSTLDGHKRFSIDEEGDAALFCADDSEFLASVRADSVRLNQEVAELRRAMDEADPLGLECGED